MRRRAAAEAARQRREQQVAKKEHRGLKRAAVALVALLVIAAIGFGAWWGNRQVWFLGTDGAGRVALYRGLPYELPFGIKLYDEKLRQPDPDRLAAAAPRGVGDRPRPALAR